MDREQAKQEIKRQASCKDYLQPSKNGMYCCPFCGSGTGPNGSGALKVYDTNTFTCFSCNRSGDVIDIFMAAYGAEYNPAISLLAQQIGITIDSYSPTEARQGGEKGQSIDNRPMADNARQEAAERPTEAPAAADYTEYYRECRSRITDPAAAAYLQGRGISLDTAAAYWIGFDPAADPAGAPGAPSQEPKAHPCPRIIIPTSTGHYIGRSIDPETPKAFAKLNPKGSSPAIFNARALDAQGVQEVFVTEGAFDALSILEAGHPAIALNSTANAEALLKRLEQHRTAATLILCLDNDKGGQEATEKLREGLQRLNIAFVTADICAGYKDPNEALTADKKAFAEAVEQAQRQAAIRPDNTRSYIDTFMAGDIERFKTNIRTGFSNLDEKAGGLYSGLYALAAISSLGKTSFALQLADQLAAGGNDVIFFSLEQSRLELVSKSIARRTAQKDRETAVTSLAIRRGYMPQQVLQAAEEYKAAVADRISIVEGNFACDVSFIGDYIRQYIQRTAARPIVFVDYLQILQPADDSKRTTKENIDNTVTELKRLSRELDLTIFIISSVNRANYLTPIDFESLKESGSIEFTCDVIFGLQLQCLNESIFDKLNNIKEKRERIKQAKSADPRKIELVCLKNRYGIANYSCYFDYFPANDLFTEAAGNDNAAPAAATWTDAIKV